jgi:long-subunit acyl-CoA synthetase (AMP-forming)
MIPATKIMQSPFTPGEAIPNIAALLNRNVLKYADNIVFYSRNTTGNYEGVSWRDFYSTIHDITINLSREGFRRGDKMVLFSRNCLQMLELELAVMAMGGIAVPIFSNFKKDTASLIINHSGATYITIEGEQQFSNLPDKSVIRKIWVMNPGIISGSECIPFNELLKPSDNDAPQFNETKDPDAICLNMYTSGTMNVPKCVQLTHKNILSQQAGLDCIWKISEMDRFLSYLPWHHSFGGIFELFTALYNGASIFHESSYGKDPDVIMENWKLAKPTVFFSVPKIYRALVEKTRESDECRSLFFNSGLKFIFTAAASLPKSVSDEFERHGIPVIEGWGLTETSPCCTLTDPIIKRESGVVGMPLPGVMIRLGEENEIQVKGPNVMAGYYDNEEANQMAFTTDNWFRTGDIGTFTESGLKLISRKDRIFKLSNGEKVIPTDLEQLIEQKCHYISFAMVAGSGKEYPVALLFPNKKLLSNPDYEISPMEGCFCPKNLEELGKCLHGCLHDANCGIGQKFAKIKTAVIINDDLSVDSGTLTPSMKLAPNNVLSVYKGYLENVYGGDEPVDQEVYVINLLK